jgi:glycosyltransferase involved in cell wall biosynthesis
MLANTLKLAVVTAFPRDPESPHGGVEAVSVSLVRALAKREELGVHVVTTDRNCDAENISQWAGATIHRLPARYGKLLVYAVGQGRRQVQAYLRSLKPDVVHAHDTYGLMVKGLEIPRVFTVHGFIYEDTQYSSQRFSRLRSILWRWVETSGWADQPHIISNSPYVRERLCGIVKGTIHDIENPTAEEFFGIKRKATNGTVFSAAVICEQKNTLGLLKAIEQLALQGTQVHLRLAGRVVDAEYGRRVEEFARRPALHGRVSMLGSINGSQVRQELASAAAFALLSFQEGAPVGIAEAMAVGVPVVTSNRCGMPYMVRHGETGFLVEPTDADDAARKLRLILTNPALATQMSLRAREIASDRFHPERVAQRTVEVYQQLLRDRVPQTTCGRLALLPT